MLDLRKGARPTFIGAAVTLCKASTLYRSATVIEARPSRTAFRVALARAAHQLLDVPKVFDDPIALEIIGEETAARMKHG